MVDHSLVAVDTNLLVCAHRRGAPEHAGAEQALHLLSKGKARWGWALPVAAEFWRAVTHPAAPGGPSAPADAAGFLERLAAAGAECWLPLAGFPQRLATAAVRHSVIGNRIYDLQIGLMCQEAGAVEIWTHDRSFAAPPGLKVIDPLR